jgi:hypothetical protein
MEDLNVNDMQPVNDRAVIGANNPPPYDPDVLAKHTQAASALAAEAAPWLNKGEVESDAEAQQLTDVIAKARKLYKDAEDARKAEKQPHMDASKAVDTAFAVAVSALEKTAASLKPIITKWLQKVEAEKQAEAARQAEIARKAKEEADRLAAQAAASNDAMAAAQAEAAQKEAAKLDKDAARAGKAKAAVGSATGGGRSMALRTVKKGRMDNKNLVYRHFMDHPDLVGVLQRLTDAAIRAGETVPGTTVIEEKHAA